jgi:hypothetical protein
MKIKVNGLLVCYPNPHIREGSNGKADEASSTPKLKDAFVFKILWSLLDKVAG